MCQHIQACVLSTYSMYRQHVRLEVSSLSIPFVSVFMLRVLRPSCFIVTVNICLFVCLESNANMTMCALDTRNDSKGDTNAVINVFLQFNSFFVFFLFITYSLLYILYLQTSFQPWQVVLATLRQFRLCHRMDDFKGSVHPKYKNLPGFWDAHVVPLDEWNCVGCSFKNDI